MQAPIVSLLYLDRFHLGDPLFLQALGRALARRGDMNLRPILVHGQGEFVQRRLESEGIFLRMHRGVYAATTAEEERLIDTSTRDLNRWLTGLLTEAVVPAVGFMGADRDLLRREGEAIRVGRVEWVAQLLGQEVVPVIASTARGDDGSTVAVDPVEALAALLGYFGEAAEVVSFTTNNLGGVMQGRDPIVALPLEDVIGRNVLADPEGVEVLVNAGARLLITNTVRYATGTAVRGTWVTGNAV